MSSAGGAKLRSWLGTSRNISIDFGDLPTAYSMPLRWLLGSVFYFARQYDLALEELQSALDLDANFAPAHFVISYCYLAKRTFATGIKSSETAVEASGAVRFF